MIQSNSFLNFSSKIRPWLGRAGLGLTGRVRNQNWILNVDPSLVWCRAADAGPERHWCCVQLFTTIWDQEYQHQARPEYHQFIRVLDVEQVWKIESEIKFIYIVSRKRKYKYFCCFLFSFQQFFIIFRGARIILTVCHTHHLDLILMILDTEHWYSDIWCLQTEIHISRV